MKGKTALIIAAVAVIVGIYVWSVFINKAVNQSNRPSKAAGEPLSISFFPSGAHILAGQDFTVFVHAKAAQSLVIRGYNVELGFDPGKVRFKNIVYQLAAVSPGLGQTDADATAINQNGKIRIMGESDTTAGFVLSANYETNIAAVTFTAVTAEPNYISYIVNSRSPKYFVMNSDYTVVDVPLEIGSNFPVNQPFPSSSSSSSSSSSTSAAASSGHGTTNAVSGVGGESSSSTSSISSIAGTASSSTSHSTSSSSGVSSTNQNSGTNAQSGAVIADANGQSESSSTSSSNSIQSSSQSTSSTSSHVSSSVSSQSNVSSSTGGTASQSSAASNGSSVSQTNTVSSTPSIGTTGQSGYEVTLNIKIKLQGVVTMPITKSSIPVKVHLGSTKQASYDSSLLTIGFTPQNDGSWTGSAKFTGIQSDVGYYLFIKGPKHLQRKICDFNPVSGFNASYSCGNGSLMLKSGNNMIDMTKILLLAGDLPENGVQNGLIESYDTSFIRQHIQSQKAEDLAIADLNYDGVIDSQDFSLVLTSILTKYDEE